MRPFHTALTNASYLLPFERREYKLIDLSRRYNGSNWNCGSMVMRRQCLAVPVISVGVTVAQGVNI